ncbi:MAG: thiamine pyrophosphate-binding protein [Candidatus Lokiarchaeota archaeon]|nr:thiamine pyrophosphate-binding protein [Candidatus Lokiarchaeota archaeon]MBD3340731.1 thiamine pyrophosphate-binding protein [Candidatus Lokiarchaeota archaeon]
MAKYTGGEIISQYLIKEGIKYVIGIPGHGCLALVDAFYKNKDKLMLIQPKQEMAGVHLAVGYYRVTGKPLCVFTSIGPGAINTAIGMADAFVDSMAVLVITGDTHVHMRGKGVLQEIERRRDSDMPRILEPISKRSWQVSSVEQLPTIMQRAFNQMLTGRPGPVHIDLPMDVQAAAEEIEIPDPLKRRTTGRSLGDPQLINEAADLLKNAKRPTIFVGGGVLTADATEELEMLAEKIGAAVVATMMGKDAFPNDHPLFCWASGSKGTTVGLKMTSEADVLLAVGCRFADESSSSYKEGVSFSIPPTKLIHIDIDPHEIGKNYPVSVGIVGDAKSCLKQLVEKLNKDGFTKDYENTDYFKEMQTEKEKWFKFLEENTDHSKDPVMISTVLKEIRKFFDRDAIIVTSSGNVQAQMLQELPFYEPKTCLTAGGFSTMGYSVPAAIGAKLGAIDMGKPDRQVAALVGDGDLMMTISELSVAVQLGLSNLFFVLINNHGWIAIKDLQQAAFGEDRGHGTAFEDSKGNTYSPDFAKIGKAFGCYAESVSKKEEIIPALERAANSGKPALINIEAQREYPHTGSPAVGWWDVPIPEYLKEKREKYEKEIEEEKL